MAKLVSLALVELGHEIFIIRAEGEGLLSQPAHHYDAWLIPWNNVRQVHSTTKDADLVIYHMGDNYGLHRGCMEWLPRLPGIVCLHDYVLTNLFTGWSESRSEAVNDFLQSWYGRLVPPAEHIHANLRKFSHHLQDVVPLTEWLCAKSHGVVTHSSWGIRRVLNATPGPVYVLPLPYEPVAASLVRKAAPSSHPKGTFHVLTFGHINPNKRAASVIEALGSSPLLRQNTTYRLVGFIEPKIRQELAALAQKHKVTLVISGEVDDTTLSEAIAEADVITCLRLPCLEAASASAITSMLSARAVIVHDIGFYSGLPDFCVKKIPPSNETGHLREVLEELYRDPAKRVALGKAAQSWARQTFRADHYAEKLVEMARAVNKGKPILAATHHFTKILNHWGATEQLYTLDETLDPLKLFQEAPAQGPHSNNTNHTDRVPDHDGALQQWG